MCVDAQELTDHESIIFMIGTGRSHSFNGLLCKKQASAVNQGKAADLEAGLTCREESQRQEREEHVPKEFGCKAPYNVTAQQVKQNGIQVNVRIRHSNFAGNRNSEEQQHQRNKPSKVRHPPALISKYDM